MSQSSFDLYRFEYLQYGDRVVDWVWLKNDAEALDYMSGEAEVSGMIYRKATTDEMVLYDDAYEDGHALGIAEARMEASNGVFYEFVSFDASSDEITMNTNKIFTCGDCGASGLDFEVKAAKTGDYYISVNKENVLWHVCTDCTSDCRHDWTSFCDVPCACGSFHTWCDTCGDPLGCVLESDEDTSGPYKRKKKDD